MEVGRQARLKRKNKIMKIMKFVLLTATLIISLYPAQSIVSAKSEELAIIKQSDRETGVVKWFSDAKGYGFITPDKGEDLFVHFRSLMGTGFKTLKAGQKVTYRVVKAQKGQQADEVQPQ